MYGSVSYVYGSVSGLWNGFCGTDICGSDVVYPIHIVDRIYNDIVVPISDPRSCGSDISLIVDRYIRLWIGYTKVPSCDGR